MALSLRALAPPATFLVLLELSVGTLLAAYVVELAGRVGRGFVGTTALICAAVTAADLLLGATLPTDIAFVHGTVNAAVFSGAVRWCLWLTVALLGFAVFCAVGTDVARRVVGAMTIAVGGMALAMATVAFGPAVGGASAVALIIAPATLVAGSSLAGMLLGHWYLVAPSLSFRPLRQVISLVFVTVGIQLAVIVVVVLTEPAALRDSLLLSSYALPFWLLVVGAGIVFTAAVALLTRHFARIRANQPATAMLYVLIISVLMGVIPAHMLFFVTGAPV